MTPLQNASVDSEVPPPAYDDGCAIQRLPAYREGHLRRHLPYARYAPTLLQRLLLSSYTYELNRAPVPVPVNFAAYVSSVPLPYESAEVLDMLERLGYTLDLEIVPRNVPLSMLSRIRCVLEV